MSSACLDRKPTREVLLELLLRDGILQRSETQPVLSRDGTSARWMLDSLPVTLTPAGAELAGRLVLERLQSFDGCQLATYGLTGAPILQSAVLLSGGRYHGLLVRKERKAHGARKLIEGRIDPEEPVVMIEDSIASGTSISEGIAALEAAGLRVEGCVALVRFGWEGGFSDLRERGYHVEAVYDIFEDFMSRMEGEEGLDHNPTKHFEGLRWSARRAPEGMHPACLAREAMQEYFASGELLLPPASLDRRDYDSSGGAWVSLRSREDIFDRHAREGFWHFPRETRWDVAEDVVRAAFRTACSMSEKADRVARLESSHVAVTLFSELERVQVADLDNNRYGVVVVSDERPDTMGGALPRMPGIRDEWQQFHHARFNNAELYPYEPYSIYRHEVAKFVEPGAVWPESGVPGEEGAPDLGSVAAWARRIAMGEEEDAIVPAVNLPESAAQIFVTICCEGRIRGCMGSEIGNLRDDIRGLTSAALVDDRFEDSGEGDPSSIAVSVSLLYNELEMGDFSREEVRARYRHGQQALALEQNSRYGLLLPFVATRMSLDAEDFVDEVIDKAGITRPPYNWIRFDCVTWLADQEGVWKLDGGFRESSPVLSIVETAHRELEYVLRNQRPDGSLHFGHYAFDNTLYQGIDVARQAHSAWMLARAGRPVEAQAALRQMRGQPEEFALVLPRDAFILLTLCQSGVAGLADVETLAGKLLESIDRHGRITTWVPPARNEEEDDTEDEEPEIDADELQSYVPGQVLLALAAAARTGLIPGEQPRIERALRYYRHRFRYRRDFGQVSWITLAFAAWSKLSGKHEWADFVFEVVDWVLGFQHSGTGAFLTDHQPDPPGFTTAVYLEAVGSAIHVAKRFDAARQGRYEQAWSRGFAFLDRLVIQDRDDSLLPNPGYSSGGLRENLYSGHVRIDFVQHALAAILEHDPDIFVANPLPEENQNGEEEEDGAPNRRSCAPEEEETCRNGG